jgi:hypothetical protein
MRASRSALSDRIDPGLLPDRDERGTCDAPTCARGTRRGDARELGERLREPLGVPLAALGAVAQLGELRARERGHHLVAAVHRAEARDSSARVPSSGRERRSGPRSARSCPKLRTALASSASASSFVTKRPPSPADRFLLDWSEKPPASADGPDRLASERRPVRLRRVLHDDEIVPARDVEERRHVRRATVHVHRHDRARLRRDRRLGRDRIEATGLQVDVGEHGMAPTWTTASGVATKLYAGTITSSPARTPRRRAPPPARSSRSA